MFSALFTPGQEILTTRLLAEDGLFRRLVTNVVLVTHHGEPLVSFETSKILS